MMLPIIVVHDTEVHVCHDLDFCSYICGQGHRADIAKIVFTDIKMDLDEPDPDNILLVDDSKIRHVVELRLYLILPIRPILNICFQFYHVYPHSTLGKIQPLLVLPRLYLSR